MTPTEVALDQAIDWMVQLKSGHVGTVDQARFEAWRTSDPAHAAAWERLTTGLGRPLHAMSRLESATGTPHLRHLLRKPPRRSVLKAMLVLAGTAAGSAWVVDRQVPLRQLSADLRTGTGERRQFTLPDGARVLLNARSAADIDPQDRQQHVVLREGDMIVEATQAGLDARPAALQLQARQVRVDITNARVLLCRLPGEIRVMALRGDAQVSVGPDSPPLTLSAGHGLRCLPQGHWRPLPDGATGAEWEDGYVAAAPAPLGDVIAALQRYTPAMLQVSAAAGSLPVHASLPLDDVDRAISALASTLPITVRHLGPWWIRLDVARTT